MSETEDAQNPVESDVTEPSVVKEDIETTSTPDNKECPEQESDSSAMTQEGKDATEDCTTEETGEKSEEKVEENVNPQPTEDSINLKETPMKTVATSVRKKPMSPFAKFRQLDRQHSSTSSPTKSPAAESRFKFSQPTAADNVTQIKERLLAWCRAKTKEYENVELNNFSTSWNNGLAFCALIHHFRPDAFDYHSLSPKNRRANFELAFRKADELAGIAPLLDVEDMVIMQRPDWKCVFTYVQSIYRRFKDE